MQAGRNRIRPCPSCNSLIYRFNRMNHRHIIDFAHLPNNTILQGIRPCLRRRAKGIGEADLNAFFTLTIIGSAGRALYPT